MGTFMVSEGRGWGYPRQRDGPRSTDARPTRDLFLPFLLLPRHQGADDAEEKDEAADGEADRLIEFQEVYAACVHEGRSYGGSDEVHCAAHGGASKPVNSRSLKV